MPRRLYKHQLMLLTLLLLTAVTSLTVSAQVRPHPATLITAEREAMKSFAAMDGVWRGPAWTILPTGKHNITQTERIGPFLDGSIKVIEAAVTTKTAASASTRSAPSPTIRPRRFIRSTPTRKDKPAISSSSQRPTDTPGRFRLDR